MAAVQRFRQGIRALTAYTQSVDYDLVDTVLTPPQGALFRRMRRSEQLHSINVLRSIMACGSTPHDLMVAALLHDVGKSRYPVAVWQKSMVVILRALVPRLFLRWSAQSPERAWARPFVVYARHPVWSAELLRAVGSTERALWLVEHHQDDARYWCNHPYAEFLRRLQAADDLN